MRTECMICDGCGRHDQVNQYEFHTTLMKTTDYMPDGWVLMRVGKETMAFHSLKCAKDHQFPKDQMALFPTPEVSSEG